MSDKLVRLVVVIGYKAHSHDFSGVVVDRLSRLREELRNVRADEWMKWVISFDALMSMLGGDEFSFVKHDSEGNETPPAEWTVNDINEWLLTKPWEKKG